MIPENKKTAVKKALQAAFGVNEFETIQQLMKGLSGAMVFKIILHEKPYLLRVITRTDAMAGTSHYFGCMQTAADAGIAPKIYYLNNDDRISITDFIAEQPFAAPEARDKMADSIRHLHALPKFPYRINYIDAADNFLHKFKDSEILPESETKDIFESYAKIVNVYPRNDEKNLVSCHNDLKPDNIIFDGNKPWIVDWEAAFLNDRYVDLASMANFVVKSDKDEADFLEKYFGKVADEYQQARFFLMSQIVHIFCFTLCTLSGAAGEKVSMKKQGKISFREFHDSLWNCTISLAGNESKLHYGLAHAEEFRRKMQTSRFSDSLRILSGYNKFH